MPQFRWTTQEQLLLALRELFKSATGLQACKIAKALNDQNATDQQLQQAFGVTAGQVQALKQRLATMAAAYRSIGNERGQ